VLHQRGRRAKDAEDFTATVSTIFAMRHWTILSVHQCRRVSDCIAMIEELAKQIEQAKSQPGGCIFGTLLYYPSKPA
jgi:hypothetical protein